MRYLRALISSSGCFWEISSFGGSFNFGSFALGRLALANALGLNATTRN